jgi:hypothetical protein
MGAPEWTFRGAVLKTAPEALSCHEKIVLLVIASHVNDLGTPAWPSFNTIADMASVSRSTAIRAVKSATEKGWISITRRKKTNGVNKSNVYRLKTPDNSFVSAPAVDPAGFDDGSLDECIAPVEKSGGVQQTLPIPGGVSQTLPGCHADTTLVSGGHPNETNEVPNELNHSKPSEAADATPVAAPKKAAAKKEPAPTTASWEAYSAAYLNRYSIEPLRSAKVNAALSTIVKTVGAEKAPLVMAHYLTLTGFYAECQHDIGILVRDLQKVWNHMHKAAAPVGKFKPQTMADYDKIDYHKGINADGTF